MKNWEHIANALFARMIYSLTRAKDFVAYAVYSFAR